MAGFSQTGAGRRNASWAKVQQKPPNAPFRPKSPRLNPASSRTVLHSFRMSWARRSRLDAFKRLAMTLKSHFDAVLRGMLDHRSNAFVEAMNCLMQQAKRAARGFRTAAKFIAIAFCG